MSDTTRTAEGSAELSRSVVLARAATLSSDECRRLYEAYRRLALGTYATRFRRALVDRYTVYQGPIVEARGALDRTLDRRYRDDVRQRAVAALARAAGGSAAAPGDPGPRRTLLRRIVLLGSWATSAILLVVLAVVPSAPSSLAGPAFGVALVLAGIATGWVTVVPNRAPTLVIAIEDAALAELRRDALPQPDADLLGQPWREALLGAPTGGPARSLLDRLAGWVGGIAVVALLGGFAGLAAGARNPTITSAGGALMLLGIASCFAVIAIVGILWVRGLVGWRAGERRRGIGGMATVARFILAAIIGGLAFGFGDAAKDAAGWVALGVAIGAGFVLGWRWRSGWAIAGYVLGGYVGTWLSVQVQLETRSVELATELGASTVVAILAGGAAAVGAGLAAVNAAGAQGSSGRTRSAAQPPRRGGPGERSA